MNKFETKIEQLVAQAMILLYQENFLKEKYQEKAKTNPNISDMPEYQLYFKCLENKYNTFNQLDKLQKQFLKAGYSLEAWVNIYNRYVDICREIYA